MDFSRFLLVLGASCVAVGHAQSVGVWLDIVTCVQNLANNSSASADSDGSSKLINHDLSMIDVFSLICQDKDGFVRCLDNSFKQSNDSLVQVIGALFDSTTVVQAYTGLCSNITALENQTGGSNVLKCFSKNTLLECQSEMADYFFYMDIVRKFASPDRKTMESLLCSVTAQRKSCEVRALKECNQQLGDVMEAFYKQTRPNVCLEDAHTTQSNSDNIV